MSGTGLRWAAQVLFSPGVPQGHQAQHSRFAPSDKMLGHLAPTTSVPSCSLSHLTARQLSGSPSTIPGLSYPRAFARAVLSARISCPPGSLSHLLPRVAFPSHPVLLKRAPPSLAAPSLLILIVPFTAWQCVQSIFCHRQPAVALLKVRTSSSPLDLQSLEQCLTRSRCSIDRLHQTESPQQPWEVKKR